MAERLQPTNPDERFEEYWGRSHTQKKAQIVNGVVRLAMSVGMTPEQAGNIF